MEAERVDFFYKLWNLLLKLTVISMDAGFSSIIFCGYLLLILNWFYILVVSSVGKFAVLMICQTIVIPHGVDGRSEFIPQQIRYFERMQKMYKLFDEKYHFFSYIFSFKEIFIV